MVKKNNYYDALKNTSKYKNKNFSLMKFQKPITYKVDETFFLPLVVYRKKRGIFSLDKKTKKTNIKGGKTNHRNQHTKKYTNNLITKKRLKPKNLYNFLVLKNFRDGEKNSQFSLSSIHYKGGNNIHCFPPHTNSCVYFT